MFGEFCLYGVFVPTLFALVLITYGLLRLMIKVFQRLNLYRYIWHPPLFNLAMYVLLFGGMSQLSYELLT